MDRWRWFAWGMGMALLLGSEGHSSEIAIQGRIFDAEGQRAAEAKVCLLPVVNRLEQAELERRGRADPNPAVCAPADAAGVFRLGAPENGMWKVVVREVGFVPMEFPLLPLVEPITLPPLHLNKDAGITVRLAGADGRALAGGRFRVDLAEPKRSPRYPKPDWQPATRLAVTDERGSAILPRGAGETLRVLAVAPGYLEGSALAAGRGRLTLKLKPGTRRWIEVRNPRGEPQPGVMVWVGQGTWPLGPTDDRGRLVAFLSPGTTLPVELLSPAGEHLTTSLATAGTEDELITLQLLAPGSVTGRVIDRHEQIPVAGALVWASADPGTFRRTDRQGAFELPTVVAGEHWLHAAAPAYFRDGVRIGTQPGQRSDAPTFALYPKLSVSGLVVDADGSPLAGVEAWTHFDPASVRGRFLQLSLSGGLAYSSPQGEVRLSDLLPDVAYTARFSRAGFAPREVALPVVRAGEPAPALRVVLHPGSIAAGLVRDGDDEPVAGAEVRMVPEPPADLARQLARISDPTRTPTYQAFTGHDGRFELSNLAPGGYRLEVRAAGFASVSVPGLEVPAGTAAVDLGTVVLAPGAVVQGRVINRREEPVEGVEVRIRPTAELARMITGFKPDLNPPAALTGPDGWFVLADQRPEERLELTFHRPGYATRSATVVTPTEEPMVVVMGATSRVTGRVADPDGQPIPRAAVTLDAPQEDTAGGLSMTAHGLHVTETVTDETGRFLFSGVEPGVVHLIAVAAGFQEGIVRGLEVPEGRDLEATEIVLAPGGVIEGTVFSPEQRAVAGARVKRLVQGAVPDPMSQSRRQVMTDGEGYYRFTGVAPGPQTIIAEHDRYGRMIRDLEAVAGVNTLDLQFERGYEVSGWVIDELGEPLTNARIELRSDVTNSQHPRQASAADGGFRFPGVRSGSYRLVVAKEGYASQRQPVMVDEGDVFGLEVLLGKGTTIIGRLIGLELDELSGVELHLGPLAGVGEVRYDGSYRIPNVAAGQWTVTARVAATGNQAQGEVSIKPPVSEVSLDLIFNTGRTLTGQVLANGDPVGGIGISLFGLDVSASALAQTDSEGRFRVGGLESGKYRLELLGSANGPRHSQEIQITTDRDVLIELAAAVVSGLVVAAIDSTPVAGVTVSLVPEGAHRFPGFDRETTTDSRGYFQFSAVTSGDWRVLAEKAGFAVAETTIVVAGGSDTEDVRLALRPTSGLILEVALASGRIPDAIVAVVAGGSGRTVAAGRYLTAQGGRVVLSTVPEGSWNVLVSSTGAATAERLVVLPTRPVNIVLPAAGSLEVVIPDLEETGQPGIVTLSSAGGRPYRSLTAGGRIVSEWPIQQGRARLAGIPTGTWAINAVAQDGRSWQSQGQIAEGELTVVEIE